MSSIGPLGPPPTAPIVNPILWAPELPTNRPQMHVETAAAVAPGIRRHLVAAAPPPPWAAEGGPPSERHVVTPTELEERAAAVHEMTFHKTSELSGARLDPHDPKAPFGATAKDDQGEPLTEREGPEDDPYGCSTGVTVSGGANGGCDGGAAGPAAAAEEEILLGDGTLASAEVAIAVLARGGDDGGGRSSAA
ncbi:hypothetical protein VOLCADRAFT_94075 [Volvox carteri f. nagariensis]|uniref:Uncharacterized protein n=1 Tax=Volvox carteri f. nagariensis TaxID=3068 RepID=D8U3U9_VOLCA|nr:uncharacterized protein VOLCADRAFT_94075 [Volvox carteri f. nagariensis]EFJ45592.1 hypothetical protein VOLCADRAFT_94075 [Volvox carteri f. nagariensis]|eukprot:XP_002953282.1 hypothetical protein VOLCADRAFT_94075 [Volvox carteri f. nagariensis]